MVEELESRLTYHVPYLADLLHSFPRFDLHFRRVNSSFVLHSQEYRESLLVWSTAPLALLLITLICFFIYFCYRCCRQERAKKQNIPCIRWTMIGFTVISCGAIIVGYYGNREAETGLENTAGAVNSAVSTVKGVQHQVERLDIGLNDNLTRNMAALERLVMSARSQDVRRQLETATQQLKESTGNVWREVSQVGQKIGSVDVATWRQRNQFAQDMSFYRWLTVGVTLTILLLLSLLLLISIARSSKCTFLLFCVLGTFSLIICWLLTSIHLSISLMLSDFCVDPDTVFRQSESDTQQKVVINYYTECDFAFNTNPFIEHLRNSMHFLNAARDHSAEVLEIGRSHRVDSQVIVESQIIARILSEAMESLIHIMAHVECSNLNEDYISSLRGLCKDALLGVVLVTLSCASVAVLFSLLIIMASIAGRNTSRRKACLDSETSAPFVTDTERIQTSYSRQRQEHPLNQGNTPPPAYPSEGFYRQYSDFSPTEDSRFG